MNATIEFPLLALSVALAICASDAGLTMVGRIRPARGQTRFVRLAAGSATMGVGLWCMEVAALLAVRMSTPIVLHLQFAALSLAAALCAAAVALLVVSRPVVGHRQVSGAGAVLGAAISGMHYAGMAAIGASSYVVYDSSLVAASAVIAVAISTASLWLFVWRRHETSRRGRLVHAAAAVGLAFAVVAMHYTATVAARVIDTNVLLVMSESYALRGASLLGPVVIASALCLSALLGALVLGERSRARRAGEIAFAESSYAASPGAAPAVTLRRRSARRSRVRTILYVEDRPDELTLVQQRLADRQDIELITTPRGKPALELARTRRPDLVLLDVHVSDDRREAALRELQQVPGSRELAVVVVSEGATPDHVDRLLATGAQACVTQPLDVEPFIAMLDRVLAVREAA